MRQIGPDVDGPGITSLEFKGEELKIQGDESMLRRLFLNLIDNAVKYNQENGRIEVTIDGRTVNVVNTGQKIPEAKRN